MKNILIPIAAICILSLFTQPVSAETATASATPTPNMEDKIKLLVQENLSTTEAKLKEKVNLQTLVGYSGKITTIGSGNFTLDSRGNLIQVTTTTNTSYTKNGSDIKMTSLGIGEKIIVIGTSVKNGIVQAKRVTVTKDEPLLVKTSAVISKIVSIDTKKKTITISFNGADQVLALSKKSTVKLTDLLPGQTILGIIKEYNGTLSISRAKAI